MPDDWIWDPDNNDARYEAVGINISDTVLRVEGAVCR